MVFPETAQSGAFIVPILLRHLSNAELPVRPACATAINTILATDTDARPGIASAYFAAVARSLASGEAKHRGRVVRAWVVAVDGDVLTFLRPALSALSGTNPGKRTDAAWGILGAVLGTSMSKEGGLGPLPSRPNCSRR
jgi:hypothetical protein